MKKQKHLADSFIAKHLLHYCGDVVPQEFAGQQEGQREGRNQNGRKEIFYDCIDTADKCIGLKIALAAAAAAVATAAVVVVVVVAVAGPLAPIDTGPSKPCQEHLYRSENMPSVLSPRIASTLCPFLFSCSGKGFYLTFLFLKYRYTIGG